MTKNVTQKFKITNTLFYKCVSSQQIWARYGKVYA